MNDINDQIHFSVHQIEEQSIAQPINFPRNSKDKKTDFTKTTCFFQRAKMATCFFSLPNSFPSKPKSHKRPIHSSSLTSQSQKIHLLNLISDQERGLKTQSDPQKLSQIIQAIDDLGSIGRDTVTTGSSLSATWRLLWTTEKEQLFIIKNASFFGTKAGDVLQVIDVEKKSLNNVITFPPDGVFFVRSTIEVASSQRVNFR